ncbi:hypothetical protein METHPM2_1410009 [Pseudomonas sp. PM2]
MTAWAVCAEVDQAVKLAACQTPDRAENTVEIFKDSTVASRLKPSRIKRPFKTARSKTFAYHRVPLNTFPMPLG